MNITYNNEASGITNLITFTDIPNILKITDTTGGSKAKINFTFNGTLGNADLPNEGYWYISVVGETIASVKDYINAINKNFCPSKNNAASTAASVAKAFRNCPTLAANFTVRHVSNVVTLEARNIGAVSPQVETNITNTYMTTANTGGSADSVLFGSMVSVDVFANGSYITTLEKNYYNGDVSFDMSPVLTTLASTGKTIPYAFSLSYVNKDGNYTSIGSMNTNYIAQGYMCNLGNKYLRFDGTPIIAMNYKRGNAKTTSNNTTLYVYGDTIPMSFYANSQVNLRVTYRNSAYEEILSYNTSVSPSSTLLTDGTVYLTATEDTAAAYKASSYVDITVIATNEVLRFGVIKPKKATEYYQRILWRNSYGGISFFDFTAAKTETRDLEVKTYQKNIYDYYTSEITEMDKIYDNDVEYKVSLKSHVIDADGRYVFNDLMQTPMAWTVIDSQKYAIIVDSVSVDEIDRNNIFEGTLKYKYSMKPSII